MAALRRLGLGGVEKLQQIQFPPCYPYPQESGYGDSPDDFPFSPGEFSFLFIIIYSPLIMVFDSGHYNNLYTKFFGIVKKCVNYTWNHSCLRVHPPTSCIWDSPCLWSLVFFWDCAYKLSFSLDKACKYSWNDWSSSHLHCGVVLGINLMTAV